MRAAVLICGKAGVGKSTFASYLASCLNKYYYSPVFIIPMAEDIKRIAFTEFGWNGEKTEAGRRLLQVLGTEVGRAYSPDIWVNKAIDRFIRLLNSYSRSKGGIMISDDVRFDNEITRCQEALDRVWVIKIGGPCRIELPGNTKDHISENDLTLDNFDIIMYNGGTKDDLMGKAMKFSEEVWRFFNDTDN